MASRKPLKGPVTISDYLKLNVNEFESDSECNNDTESDSGKSELDEEYYRIQPPPIPIDVLLANTVNSDGQQSIGVTLPKNTVSEPYKNLPNRCKSYETQSRLENERYDEWKKVEANDTCQPPPIPVDVLLTTVNSDGQQSIGVTLPTNTVSQPHKNLPNRYKSYETQSKLENEHYNEWKNVEANDRFENHSLHTKVEVAQSASDLEPFADADQSCCTFLCDSIKSCCVIL